MTDTIHQLFASIEDANLPEGKFIEISAIIKKLYQETEDLMMNKTSDERRTIIAIYDTNPIYDSVYEMRRNALTKLQKKMYDCFL